MVGCFEYLYSQDRVGVTYTMIPSHQKKNQLVTLKLTLMILKRVISENLNLKVILQNNFSMVEY